MIDSQVLEERIRIISSAEPEGEVNCISAAFFLLGLSNTERYIDPSSEEVYIVVQKSTPVLELQDADFVVARAAQVSSKRGTMRNNSHGARTIQHMAVVRNPKIGTICDRFHYNGPFRPSIPLKRLQRELKSLERQGMYSPFSFELYKL